MKYIGMIGALLMSSCSIFGVVSTKAPTYQVTYEGRVEIFKLVDEHRNSFNAIGLVQYGGEIVLFTRKYSVLTKPEEFRNYLGENVRVTGLSYFSNGNTLTLSIGGPSVGFPGWEGRALIPREERKKKLGYFDDVVPQNIRLIK